MVSPIAKANDGLAFEAVCLIKFPAIQPDAALAPKILLEVPSVSEFTPVIILPNVNVSVPLTLVFPLNSVFKVLLIIILL